MERNRYSAKYAQNNSGVWFIDSYHQLLDVATVATSVAGSILAANSGDGLHPNAVGSRVVGIHAANILNNLLPIDSRRSIGGSDGTSGDLNNACLNALMLGSGGSAGTGASGTIPQYWGAARNAGAGITGVISQVARTNGRGNWMRATLANAAGAATDTFRFTRQYSVGSAGTIGDTVFAECDVAYNVTTGTLNKLELVVFAFTSGFATLYTVASNYTDVGAGKALALTGTDEITLVTPSFVVPATTAYLFFAFTMGLSVGGDATADIGSAFMGKTTTT